MLACWLSGMLILCLISIALSVFAVAMVIRKADVPSERGPRGETGQTGKTGDAGETGETGPAGPPGAAGKSAKRS